MTTVFLATFVIGLAALAGTAVFGEFDSDVGDDGLPFLSLTAAATALFGLGAGGLVGELAFDSTAVAVPLGLGTAVVAVFLTRGLLLPYLRRQQANSHTGRAAIIGTVGTVTLDIPAGQWGEVEFTAPDGGRARMRAISDEDGTLRKGARVYINDADKTQLHVVAIPPTDQN